MQDNKGFTLIELLIVVVIIGILAAIAIPKFSATREKAYFAAMKSDLKNLASAQEIYYMDVYSYTTDTDSLAFTNSAGVTTTITANATGWSGASTHAALGASEGCALYYGDIAVPTSPTTPGNAGVTSCTG